MIKEEHALKSNFGDKKAKTENLQRCFRVGFRQKSLLARFKLIAASQY